MIYEQVALTDAMIPRASAPLLQHLLDTYASETNKVATIWRCFEKAEMGYQPHLKSTTVLGIMKHQLLSERRFFAEFLSLPEPAADQVLPEGEEPQAYCKQLVELAGARLAHLAAKEESWWLEEVPFFDVKRQRVWIFWRRVLHTAHHRTQLTGYLRLLEKAVPSTYGPTADVSWTGADPTKTVAAAGRK